MKPAEAKTATRAWLETLNDVFTFGTKVAPRGQATSEILQHTMLVDMRYPVVDAPSRKLSTKFLGAEAHWMLSGDDRVSTIAPFNSNIAQFSDDGVRFFGAYGPRIKAQIDYVVNALVSDRDTRQAGLTLWRENPQPSKDIPCTITMFFNLRRDQLNMHVFMRSSDVWLGVPYDVFNFSMVAHLVAGMLRQRTAAIVVPGTLHLTAASRHLYERDRAKATSTWSNDEAWVIHNPTPEGLYTEPSYLMDQLDAIRHEIKLARWWVR